MNQPAAFPVAFVLMLMASAAGAIDPSADYAPASEKSIPKIATSDQVLNHILGIDANSEGLDLNGDGSIDAADLIISLLPPAPLTVLSPNGGEVWNTGLMREVRFQNRVSVTGAAIDIALIRKGLKIADLAAVQSPSGEKTVPIAVPNVQSHDDYRVRVGSASNPEIFDDSDAGFTISPNPIQVLAPMGGESWSIGSEQPVHFSNVTSVTGIFMDVDLMRAGVKMADLADPASLNGELMISVTVPDMPVGDDYRVRVGSFSMPGLSALSEGAFSITPPVPPPPYDLMAYFPLALGNLWRYRSASGTESSAQMIGIETINGIPSTIFDSSGGLGRIAYAWQGNSLFVTREMFLLNGQMTTLTYHPPLEMGDRDIVPGETFITPSTDEFMVDIFQVMVELERTVVYQGLEPLTVPFGSFPHALRQRVVTVAMVSVVGFGMDTVTINEDTWLVQDLGRARTVGDSSDGSMVDLVLIDTNFFTERPEPSTPPGIGPAPDPSIAASVAASSTAIHAIAETIARLIDQARSSASKPSHP